MFTGSNCLLSLIPLLSAPSLFVFTALDGLVLPYCSCPTAVAGAGSAGASAAVHGPQGVSCFVQLSDIHINKFTHHEILPDLLAFGDAVLSSVRPAALLVTGDLVDAKTLPEGSQQHPEEWNVSSSSSTYHNGVTVNTGTGSSRATLAQCQQSAVATRHCAEAIILLHPPGLALRWKAWCNASTCTAAHGHPRGALHAMQKPHDVRSCWNC